MPLANHLANEVDGGFDAHKPVIARLYLTEGRTLEDVREMMATKYHFNATIKMYKWRFKKWGWRKNIRFDQPLVLLNDAGACAKGGRLIHVAVPAAAAAAGGTAGVAAAAGGEEEGGEDRVVVAARPPDNELVVDRERLEAYLRRRERRGRQQRLGNLAHVPVAVRPPDRFLASQTVLVNIQEYLLCRYTEVVATAEAFGDRACSRRISASLFSWDRYTYAVTEALETPGGFQDAMVLLRRAPQELATLLRTQPFITTSDLCVFVLYLTRPRAYRDAQQRAQFYKVVRALFRVAAGVFDWPPHHPMLKIFEGFHRASDEDLHHLATQGWRFGCSTVSPFLDALGPTTPARASSSSSVVGGGGGGGGTSRAPPDPLCLLDETVRRARAGYLTTRPWCLESTYLYAEVPDPTPRPAAPAPVGPRPDWRAAADETVANTHRALELSTVSDGPRLMTMRALFDAHGAYAARDPVQRRLAVRFMRDLIATLCGALGAHDPMVGRYLAELEGALLAWGEAAGARDVARWRVELLGPRPPGAACGEE